MSKKSVILLLIFLTITLILLILLEVTLSINRVRNVFPCERNSELFYEYYKNDEYDKIFQLFYHDRKINNSYNNMKKELIEMNERYGKVESIDLESYSSE